MSIEEGSRISFDSLPTLRTQTVSISASVRVSIEIDSRISFDSLPTLRTQTGYFSEI